VPAFLFLEFFDLNLDKYEFYDKIVIVKKIKKPKPIKNLYSDYDSGWKEIIEIYFSQFVKFYYPELDKIIDYEKGYEFLDKELLEIITESNVGNREADKLVKVYLKSGEEKWILFHIEVQVQKAKDLAQRMYIYNYKIFEKYKKDVVSILILGDDNKTYRPSKYERKYEGCRLLFEYKLVKLIDYNKTNLERNKNVFATITLSHLKALEAGSDKEKKKIFKLELVRKLRKKGYTIDELKNLHKFIDWLIRLPVEDEKEIKEEVKKIEEVIKMPMILTAERIAMEEGKKEGKKEGKFEVAKRMLKKGLDLKFIAEVTGLPIKQLKICKV
jgi:hypothetical protein